MNYIRGKFKQLIYEGDNGYKVGLFRVKESTEELEDLVNKTITFTGYFPDINGEDYYILYGKYIENARYGKQFQVTSYEKEEPKGKDAIITFLASPLIKGCGEKTAENIVNTLGDNAIKLIKEDINVLLQVPGISEKKALRIYESINKYQSTDDIIINLQKKGFSVNESLAIINKYGENSISIVEENIYSLIDIIDFSKIDSIFLNNKKAYAKERVKACIIESFKRLGMKNGDTYSSKQDLFSFIRNEFKIFIEEDEFLTYLNELILNEEIILADIDKYFLKDYYTYEEMIAENLLLINNHNEEIINNFDNLLINLEAEKGVKYNKEQKDAIRKSLENRVSIITGGPGTGKTTIINAIVQLYIRLNNINPRDVLTKIALLAPTGRAAKKISESTGLPASTIHRYLKWNKETNEFQINEYNKNYHKLIIVDETSMIDTFLFYSLLQGINHNIKLILVGDSNQLPSVGPGMILNDIINSNLFTHIPLEHIYRQSENSYIPVLAREIKNRSIDPDFTNQKDDYNFLKASGPTIKEMIKKICLMSNEKGLNENDIQILAPMYKGENGIDNLNVLLQNIFNPKDKEKKEIKYGDVIYREEDKVLQLVNDPDNNVFNGDIGYIKNITTVQAPTKRDILTIDFDGNQVLYNREDLNNIKHAYAITIHKSQGSEFSHVIMPISKSYYKMLYNKLIYTGVSRAKKSLVIIGEKEAFLTAINNDYSNMRKTNLTERLIEKNNI